jgi:hypothetical protein
LDDWTIGWFTDFTKGIMKANQKVDLYQKLKIENNIAKSQYQKSQFPNHKSLRQIAKSLNRQIAKSSNR